MASTPLRWGIISTGKIARTLADAIRQSRTGELLAVGSRRQETAAAFGAEFDVPRRYGSYDALLADPDVDVVYNALPNHLHAEWTIKAAQAGRHILCEKPLATNVGQGDGARRGRALPRRISARSLHVPLPSPDRQAGRAYQSRCRRRGAPDPGQLHRQHRPQTGQYPPTERRRWRQS